MKLLLSVSLHHLRENSPSALRACCKKKTKQKAGIFNLLAAVNPLRALLLGAEHRIHFQSCTNCNKGSADGSVTSERGRTKASPLTSEKSPLITHINHKAAGDTKTYSTAAHTHTHTQTHTAPHPSLIKYISFLADLQCESMQHAQIKNFCQILGCFHMDQRSRATLFCGCFISGYFYYPEEISLC